MRKFLIQILWFFSPLIILSYPLDIFISKNLQETHEYPGEFEVWNDIYRKKIDCDIAIYGSSRAWVHFNTKMMEVSLHKNVYNFGIDGHNFIMQYMRHREYLKNNKPPKLIILSLDMFSLKENQDLYHLEQFLPYMLWNKTIYKYTAIFNGFHKLDYLIPLLRYYGKSKILKTAFTNYFSTDHNNYRYNGFRGMTKDWDYELEKSISKNEKYEIKIDPSIVFLLKKFLDQCDDNNIEVVLVYAPEYVAGQKFVTNRKSIIKLFREIANKKNLLFLNYSDSPICRNKNLFYNSSHLNSKGADLFTKLLIDDFNNYQIMQQFFQK